MEEVRASSGLRHSIGELLTCRLVATTFTALTGADFLQPACARARRAAS